MQEKSFPCDVFFFVVNFQAMKLLTTKEVAVKLGLSAIRVRELIRAGKIQAQQVGRDWVIEEAALENVTVYGKAGRPPKTESAGNSIKPKVGAKKQDPGTDTSLKANGKAANKKIS
jgi:excisionase family DNA binding protein